MSSLARSVIITVFGRDKASPAFLKMAASADKAAAATERAAATSTGAMRTMARASAKMSAVGATMTRSLTVPIAAVAAYGANEAIKYEKNMALIRAATDESAKGVEILGAKMKQIATSTGTDMDALAEGAYMAEKAVDKSLKGYARGAQAAEVLRVAAEGAKAENVDLGIATEALTTVMMSYGLSAKQAVGAENEIIRGSGLAKTTMQDFANSLSNIVPIASSLGISFPEIAGAIATMTQHGETAQRSTENLANLVTNLAGSNNVATAAMQQLDINVVDLQKHLGERGLTGTLEVVLDQIAKNSKGGMVVVDAFKHAALATQSLNTMIEKMPPRLAELSQGLLDGKVSLEDYRDSWRAMSANAPAMGADFQRLFLKTKGFSDLLKAGRGEVQTTARALQQMLGGVTGMRTALMLTGSSTKAFHHNVKSIGEAFHETKGDVLGWNLTVNTTRVKLDKAKESIKVAALEIGSALLPAIKKLADGVRGVVNWFKGLPDPVKDAIKWIALVAAAAGPLLAIFGRLGKLVLLTWGLMAGTAKVIAGIRGVTLATEAMNTAQYRFGSAIGRSALATQAAVAAIGTSIGVMIGFMARGKSAGTQAFAAISSAATGAAVGFAVGGPVGAAVGGITGLVGSLGAMFIGAGNDARNSADVMAESLADTKTVADGLLSTLRSINGALGKQFRNAVNETLADRNIYDQSPGISGNRLLQAALHGLGSDEYNSIERKVTRLAERAGIDSSRGKQIMQWWESFRRTVRGVADSERHYEQQQDAVNHKWTKGGKALREMLHHADKLKKLFHGTDLTGGGNHYVPGVGFQLDAAEGPYSKRNEKIIESLVKGVGNLAIKEREHGKSVLTVARNYVKRTKALSDTLVKLGFEKKLVQGVIAQYTNLPKSVVTDVKANTKEAKRDAAALQDMIDKIHQGKVPGLTANSDEAKAVIAELQSMIDAMHGKDLYVNILQGKVELPLAPILPGVLGSPSGGGKHHRHAAGGELQDGWFTVGEKGFELGYRRGGKVTIFPHEKSKRMLGVGDRLPGFAGGTKDHLTDKQREQLDNEHAAHSAMLSFIRAARAMSTSASELRQAARDMIKAAKQAKASNEVLKELTGEGKLLGRLGHLRDVVSRKLGTPPPRRTAYDKLAAAKEAFRNERQSVLGGFRQSIDVTTMGQDSWGVTTTSGLVAKFKDMAAKAKRFGKVIHRLAKRGLSRFLLDQLIQAGPPALDAALALDTATPAQFRSIQSSYRTINQEGKDTGKYLANQFYGAGVKSAKHLVKGLKSERSELTAAIRLLGREMADELATGIGIKHGPALGGHLRKIEQHFHIHGITDPEAFARAVARRLANRIA